MKYRQICTEHWTSSTAWLFKKCGKYCDGLRFGSVEEAGGQESEERGGQEGGAGGGVAVVLGAVAPGHVPAVRLTPGPLLPAAQCRTSLLYSARTTDVSPQFLTVTRTPSTSLVSRTQFSCWPPPSPQSKSYKNIRLAEPGL